MFQWFVEIEIPNTRTLEAFGPEHADEATAKAWIRKAALASSGPYRLAGPPVRTRTVVVLEGLDDEVETVAGPSTAESKRKRRTKAEIEAEEMAAEQAANATARQAKADALAAEQAENDASRAAIRAVYLEPAPIPMVAAGVGEAGYAALEALGKPADPVDDDACTDERGPLPPALAASGMAEAMGIVTSTAAAAGPSVDVRGVLVELCDGSAWHWQKFQTPTTAERTAKKAQEAIDCDDPVEMAKQLRGIVTMLKRGRIPATEG